MSSHTGGNYFSFPKKNIYVIGEIREINIIKQCSKFDIAENKWEKLVDLNLTRYDALGVGTKEKIYVARGWLDFDEITNTCEVYNKSTDEWNLMCRLTVFRPFGNLVFVGNSLYAVGGAVYDFFGKIWSIECYDQEKDELEEKERTPCVENISPYQASSFTFFKEDSVKLKRYKGIFRWEVLPVSGNPNQSNDRSLRTLHYVPTSLKNHFVLVKLCSNNYLNLFTP